MNPKKIVLHIEGDVAIEDINGDVSDLLGKPLLLAEEISTETVLPPKDADDHCTWTF